ncbi:ArsR/SmtB family transcription factor [Microlunatus sp. GCM10028923]|uniref:ArsR/SmtB family transcription factor n=1 Tax=Microlunatus sp. GCM10028923 TaxID=3273400 RepID=UPI00361DE7A5
MVGPQNKPAVSRLRAVVSDPATLRPLARDAAESLAQTLRVVADPTRLQLLSMIQGSSSQEATVGDLANHLGLRQPTITHHLRLMHEEGLLLREQRGRNVWYSIAPDRRSAIADLLR